MDENNVVVNGNEINNIYQSGAYNVNDNANIIYHSDSYFDN